MDGKQTRIAKIAQDSEQVILDRIVNAMLAVEQRLFDASVDEWSRLLTDSCRMQKLANREMLATTC